MKILHEICSLPTAPFNETAVLEYARRFVAERPKLKLTADHIGNLLIELPGRTRSPRLVFVAHTDHPGFIARRMLKRGVLEADFRGGVLSTYVQGSRVRFFDDAGEGTGVVSKIVAPSTDRKEYPGRVQVRVDRPIAPGAPGMFDQGEGRVKKGLFYARAIDDTGGVAAALTMLDELVRRSSPGTVAVLLTRAEEDGFIGAIATVLHPELIRKTDLLVSIECSAKQPYAKQGDGVIIRVGDRTSVFHSGLTHFLTTQAQAIATKDKTFRYQRCLMPGGTCEATVYDAYGYTCAAICVPLGNYHNMDREKKQIGPEYIDVSDWKNMVRLFVQTARQMHTYEPGLKPLKKRIEKRFNQLKKFL